VDGGAPTAAELKPDAAQIGTGSENEVVLHAPVLAVNHHVHARPDRGRADTGELGHAGAPARTIGTGEIGGHSGQFPVAVPAQTMRAGQRDGQDAVRLAGSGGERHEDSAWFHGHCWGVPVGDEYAGTLRLKPARQRRKSLNGLGINTGGQRSARGQRSGTNRTDGAQASRQKDSDEFLQKHEWVPVGTQIRNSHYTGTRGGDQEACGLDGLTGRGGYMLVCEPSERMAVRSSSSRLSMRSSSGEVR